MFLVACSAALVWGDSGAISPPPVAQKPIDQPSVPFRMGAGPARKIIVTYEWVIPVGRRSISVPILMYHYVHKPPSTFTDRLGFNLSVSPNDFRGQMDWLESNDFHPVDFNDLRAYFAGQQALPNKPVVITFDDGYRDLYTTAFPILKAHKFKAVAYIVSSFVDRRRYVTSAQVVEMGRNGIEIASHTVNHADLARTSWPMIIYELVASKVWLQQLLGQSVVDFAYPSGKFNAKVVAALRATGYDTAVTTIGGTYHSQADRYTWTRIRISGGESLLEFVKALGPVEKAVEITDIDFGPVST